MGIGIQSWTVDRAPWTVIRGSGAVHVSRTTTHDSRSYEVMRYFLLSVVWLATCR